jgi:polysaccharide export outer membrane protein
MKTKFSALIGQFTALGVMSVSLTATAQSSAPDRITVWQQQNQLQQRADQAQAMKSASTGQLQREIDKLSEKKTQIEREVDYAQAKFQAAARQLKAAQAAGTPEEVDRLSRETGGWDTRLKASQADLSKIDADIKAKVEELKKILVDGSPTANIIVPGDALQLFVLEDESFNGLYQVRRGGYIILPRIGRVLLVGRDVSNAEKTIKDALEQSQLRQATVQIERTRGALEEESGDIIYLAGEFITPGPLKIPAGVNPTAVTTILRAGGLTPSADLQHVKMLRLEDGKGLVEEVNVQSILDGTGLQSDLALNAGDILVVPGFAPIVYVTGNVKTPSQLKLTQDEDLTAYAAILKAGGFARFANLKAVYVVRDHGNGEKSKIPVNIKDVQSGKSPDVVLRGKDIIVVPERFFSF